MKRLTSSAIIVLIALLLSEVLLGPVLGQKIDPARAKTLTVEQASELLKQPNSLHLNVTDLSPEVAAVLAKGKGQLIFEALTNLSPETAAALAAREGHLSLPKLNSLPTAVAKALSGFKGPLELPGIKELSIDAAEALASHSGALLLGVTELSDDVAAALGKHQGDLSLPRLTSLTSLPLATRLGKKEGLNLGNLTKISSEIAQALCPPENKSKKGNWGILIGLTEMSPDVARALAVRGVVMLPSIPKISDETAAGFAKHTGKIALYSITEISAAAAKSLSKNGGGLLVINSLADVSDEAALEFATGNRHVELRGLTKLNSVPLALRLIQLDGPHAGLPNVSTVSDEVALALANLSGKQLPLPGLTSLTSVPLAAKQASLHDNLKLPKLTAISDDVARALARQKGKLDLSGLQSLSPAVANALAKHEGELKLDGVKEISDDAAKELAQTVGTIALGRLESAFPAAVLGLKTNAKITVSKNLHAGISPQAGEITNSLGMRLASIPAGKFLMGSPTKEAGRESQETQHEVELTKGFYLGVHEVTVGQFKQFVRAENYQTDGEKDGKGAYGIDEAGKIEQKNPKFTWKSPGFEQTDDHPVVDVTWNDAKAFCKWLSEKEKRTYRLPTEAEWEYACRAGTKTAYVHGDDPEILATVGNGADATARARYPGWSIGVQGKDGHIFTAPVGQFKANAFGLYDMHGNVWEWCEDWYEPNSYPEEKQVDPTGPATGKAKVQRGGGWSSDAKRLRSAARVGRDPSAYRGCYLGFRVALVQTHAEAPKESGAAAEKTAGGRVAYMLLLNGAVTDAVVKSANIEGHKSVAPPYVGTWHSFVKGMDQIQKGRLDPVERGDIDVMMIGTLLSYPQAEAWKNHLGPDDSTMAGFAALGVKNNPKFRICWQTYIWPVGQERKDGTKTLDVAATKKRAANEPLKELEKLVDAINEKHGRKVVLISPVGEATIKLVQMVADGKFPGITDPADLWVEFNMHSHKHVLALTAYCNVATMYGVSPVGLTPDFSKATYGGGKGGPVRSMEGITDEQNAILQRIAWETVSKYRHAGIASTK